MTGKLVKIACRECGFKGYLELNRYPDGRKVKVVCPVCEGKKYTLMTGYEKEEAKV